MKIIPLTKGQSALIDDQDYDLVKGYNWRVLVNTRNLYAITNGWINGKRTAILMHRLLNGFPHKMCVDHKDGNGLNNTRANMRVCTYSQNLGNRQRANKNKTSQFKGVSWNSEHKVWIASIQCNKKQMNLGKFPSEVEAAKSYDAMALKHFKEFSYTNFKY